MGDEDDDEVLGCATTASGQSASTNSLPPPAANTLLKLNHRDDNFVLTLLLIYCFMSPVCEKVENRGRTVCEMAAPSEP